MKFRTTVAAATSLLVITGLLAACSGAEPEAAGDTLTIAQAEAIDTWNPQEALIEQSFAVYPQVFGTLLTASPDGSEIEPGLATEYEFDDTANTITFHLDPDAVFSDGTPLTAADVQFSEGLWAAGELYGSYFATIESVAAPDEHTAVFTLNRPDHALLGILATANAAIVPKDFAGADADTFWKKPISAGAYAIASQDTGQSITLERNEHFDADEAAPQTVKYVVVPDATQQLLQFQSGEVDVVNNVQLDSVGQYDSELLQSTTASGLVVLAVRGDVAPLDDPQFRRAISLAIDHPALIEGGFSGLATEATTVLPQIVPGVAACDTCDWPAGDVDEAKALIAASGYDGRTITVTVASAGGPETLAAQALVPMLTEVGIDVKLETVAPTTFIERLENSDFEIAPISYSALAPSALDPLGFLGATEIMFTGSDVAAANTALDALTSATDEEGQHAATAGFEAWAYEQAPLIPLAVPDVIYAVSADVQGFVPNPYKAWYVKDVSLAR